MGDPVYVLVDGDNVGEKIDLLVLQGDLQALTEFTRGIDLAVGRVAALARDFEGAVFMAGGDNILARLSDLPAFLDRFALLRADFCCPFSMGIGPEARDAHVALKVAKAYAPGTVVRARAADGELRFVRQDAAGEWVPVEEKPRTALRKRR